MSIHCPSLFMTSDLVIVHELAHQWFGDSVSLENWKDIWVKEGFATYSEWLWTSKNDPGALARIAKTARMDFLDNPSVSVAEPEYFNLYTDESHTSAALRLQVGDEAFFQILQTYTERYRYGNVRTDEFITIVEEVSGEDLKTFFDA